MSDIYLIDAPVIANDRVAEDIFWMQLNAPEIARVNRPGQFINILTNPDGNPLWRRPFSVARLSDDNIHIIFKVIGRGTRQMAELQPGDLANILGPLGNHFTLQSGADDFTPLLIGGGLGFAPLVILRDFFVNQDQTPVLFMGALSKSEHYYTNDDRAELYVTSDDGTLGYHGLVTEQLVQYLQRTDSNTQFKAYSCGPEPMMRAVAHICGEYDIPLELSIEREMACGIGLCQGCTITQVAPQKKYALVCKDGPIFNASHLKFIHD